MTSFVENSDLTCGEFDYIGFDMELRGVLAVIWELCVSKQWSSITTRRALNGRAAQASLGCSRPIVLVPQITAIAASFQQFGSERRRMCRHRPRSEASLSDE